MNQMKFNYQVDKETKNTYRFQPDAAAQDLLGQATIYIRKDALKALGIDPTKTLVISFEAKEATDND